MRRFSVFAILVISAMKCLGQQEKVRFAWEGGAALDYQVGKYWTFNSSVWKRSIWSTSDFGNDKSLNGNLAFLEVNQFVTQSINRTKLSVGYKYRWVDPRSGSKAFEHRLTQQMAHTHFEDIIRLVSRIRIEQRIRDTSFAHRYRYRFSIDFPLSGENIDPGECYMVGTNEILFEAVNDEQDTWENRSSINLGYLISSNQKLELSFTYRLEDLNIETNGILFINTGYFISLK
ncbi:MAG: DUF2490 domain-containing protein [Cyclobacteriaceae bacterium]|nr:DUF2490 domain-containing protein [Cyclobacteriaceae bacterium HetDA_MAG_MS6]